MPSFIFLTKYLNNARPISDQTNLEQISIVEEPAFVADRETFDHKVVKLFQKVKIDYTWSFSDKTTKDTSYITHGYYTYPAKFIPQLASRLIQTYSQENDIVVDVFGGSGTTVVEAMINKSKIYPYRSCRANCRVRKD